MERKWFLQAVGEGKHIKAHQQNMMCYHQDCIEIRGSASMSLLQINDFFEAHG